MATEDVGAYIIEMNESVNERATNGVAKKLWNVAITHKETNETIEIDDIVSPYARESWCATVFNNAKEGLDHDDGPDCCYVTARYRS